MMVTLIGAAVVIGILVAFIYLMDMLIEDGDYDFAAMLFGVFTGIIGTAMEATGWGDYALLYKVAAIIFLAGALWVLFGHCGPQVDDSEESDEPAATPGNVTRHEPYRVIHRVNTRA